MDSAPGTHVEFERVCKSYDGRVQVVRDLDLSVHEGEFLTLLGASGSGKTTCLMMLAGFEAPTSGSIRIRGRPVHDLPPRKRGIGIVFQNYALFPHMTVGGNLAFPLEVRRLDARQRRERVQRALQLVRLEGFEDRRPNELSGGQQQRVAIARALVFEPSLVLMDEPLGALDRRLREEMQYEIRRIQRTLGITVLYVTHDQQEAMVMSDRVAVFRRGRIEQVALPETLYEEPERPFVAGFIGENNMLRGRVLSVEKDISRVEVGGQIVQAFQVTPCKPGDPVVLAIRPERVCLAPEPEVYANRFEAGIEDIFSWATTCACGWRYAAERTSSSRFPISSVTAPCWRATACRSAGRRLIAGPCGQTKRRLRHETSCFSHWNRLGSLRRGSRFAGRTELKPGGYRRRRDHRGLLGRLLRAGVPEGAARAFHRRDGH